MVKHFKRQLMFSMFLVFLLSVSCIYSSAMCSVYATEVDLQNKTVEILDDVIGITTVKYVTSLTSEVDGQYQGLVQNEIDLTLESNDSKFRASCYFVNNSLRQIYLSDYDGNLSTEYPVSDTVEMAKSFLKNYQNYVGDSFYGELALMLDNIDATKNTTKASGNIMLEVLNSNQMIVDYVWKYTDENGIVAHSKKVTLSYDKGQLKVFLNNWPLYTVVDNTSKISGEEATEIALEEVKTFSYEVTTENVTSTITGFDVAPDSLGHETLSYLNNPNQTLARGRNSFVLYPSWYVPIGFNQSYPGAVTGITVTVWADTGEVSNTNPMVISLSPLTSNEEQASQPSTDNETAINNDGFTGYSVTTLAVVTIAISSIMVISLFPKKQLIKSKNKNVLQKFSGTLICGMLMFSLVITSISTVNADEITPDSKARIYAAYNSDPPQLAAEQTAATWACGQIAAAFTSSGYSASNLAGSSTTYSNVYANAYYDEDDYDRVAIFHFGHLTSFNTAYQDNYGNDITSSNLESSISSQTHDFVFIWVCAQAQDNTYGMPEAWTNRNNLGANGYSSPDGNGQCYIGFENFSPMISLTNGTSFSNQTTNAVKYFIKYFYDYALKDSYAVRDALNRAAIDFFGDTYTSSILYQGYGAWYSGDQYHNATYYPGKMNVFGDGAIWVFQPKISLTSSPSLSPTFYINGEPYSVGDIHVWAPETYTITVSDVDGYDFDYFTYNGVTLGRPATIQLTEDGAFTAHYSTP